VVAQTRAHKPSNRHQFHCNRSRSVQSSCCV